RQQGVGTLLLDDPRHGLPLDRLDIGGVGHGRVGHDGGRVGVHQDDPETLFAQRLAGLCAGIVELAGLADDDGPGAEDQNTLDVSAFWHVCYHSMGVPETQARLAMATMKRSTSGATSTGSGLASV